MERELKFNDNMFYKALIVSNDLFESAKKILENFNIKIINSYVNERVNPYLSKHADMQIVRVGQSEYVCAPECYEYYKDVLKEFNIKLNKGETYLSSNYPYDIAYNIVVTEKFAVHKMEMTDSILKQKLVGRTLVNVKQGYTACNLCTVSHNSFITSDEGITKTLFDYECDVLNVTNSNIVLNGFDCGFIGGASFKIGDNILALNGNVYSHDDAKKIIEFCNSKNIELISLSENKITDIGSAVAII